jgi:hypothetical protein
MERYLVSQVPPIVLVSDWPYCTTEWTQVQNYKILEKIGTKEVMTSQTPCCAGESGRGVLQYAHCGPISHVSNQTCDFSSQLPL